MVDLRIYPFFLRINLIIIFLYLVFWIKPIKFPSLGLKFFNKNFLTIYFLIFIILIVLIVYWFFQTSLENNFLGLHCWESKAGFKLGIIFFIISEVCFFFSFFWSYFHISLSRDINIGLLWPPVGVYIVNPFSLPLLNSIILISSGLSVTVAHYECFLGDSSDSVIWLLITIILGWLFLFFQIFEYNILIFSFIDSIFGRIFFLGTGFHGLHVLLGRIILLWILKNFFLNYSWIDLLSLEIRIWYWHFVDVVWLFLYFWFYWWPK